jgi:glycyl-tRNA synthetase beta chain
LTKAELAFERVEWFAAPRRLALKCTAAATQLDKQVEKRGPAVNAALLMASQHRQQSAGPALMVSRLNRPNVW